MDVPRDERVYHPLDRLRDIIRRYVVIEGILSALIFLGAWLGLALLLDYVVFKTFTWDWVQDGGRWMRAVALVTALTLLAGIVVFRIVRRLTTEFSYPALALVLERRFPKVLGDRLITAVELADVEKAVGYGYSREMIHVTIKEARDRVGTVPVNDVFNWRRLRIMGLIAVGIPLAILVVAFASHAIATREVKPVRAGWKFFHVSTILAERNVLLLNTPWPRRALIELQGDAQNGLRVARDGAPPHIKVKSYRWVIADRSRPDGWRPLMWSDVTESLVGIPIPEPSFASVNSPEGNSQHSANASEWTVDHVDEIGRDDPSLKPVLDRLDAMADDPSYGRKLRHLDTPGSVGFEYSGVKTSGSGTLNPEGNSEHAGDITGLKEDVEFVIKAEDYRTQPRTITLIPPPTLTKLARVEYQPAYLHYAPPLVPDKERPNAQPVRGGYIELRGLRQQMPEEKLSLTGDKSVFIVPAGTEVVITGVTELSIARAFARPKVGRVPGAKPGSADLVPLNLSDGNTFSIEFRGDSRVTSPVEFDLVFENADKVTSTRPVLIQVTEDQAPVVEIAPEVIRRIGNVYYVTPRAKIPFNPESYVKDDNGLSKVEYTANYYSEDSDLARVLRAGLVTRAIVPPAGPANPAGVLSLYHARAFRTLDKGDTRQAATYLLGQFIGLENAVKRETKEHMESLLKQPLKGEKTELVKRFGLETKLVPNAMRTNGRLESFKWDVNGDYFDIKELNLEVAAGDVQPRYRIDLNIQATDTNYDTGPKSASNAEPIRLLVVSAGDLLVEIGKEEETLGAKLDEALVKLAAAKSKYVFVNSKHITRIPDEIDAVRERSKGTGQDLAKAREVVQNVARDFRKIERECVINQLDEKTIVQYGRFANRLDRVLGENPQTVSPEEEERLLSGEIAPKQTFPATEKLIATAHNMLEEGRYADPPGLVTEADLAINALEREVADIRKVLGEAQSKERLKKLIMSIIENQEQRVRAEIKKWEEELNKVLVSDEPFDRVRRRGVPREGRDEEDQALHQLATVQER